MQERLSFSYLIYPDYDGNMTYTYLVKLVKLRLVVSYMPEPNILTTSLTDYWLAVLSALQKSR